MKKSEEMRLKQQLGIVNRRGETFVGYRPAEFDSKRKDIKSLRTESKKICMEY